MLATYPKHINELLHHCSWLNDIVSVRCYVSAVVDCRLWSSVEFQQMKMLILQTQ